MRTVNFKGQLRLFLLPISLFFILFLMAKSPRFLADPSFMSIGITLDLILTVPLMYFFLIRKKNISKNTVVLVFSIGLFIGYKIIPSEHRIILPVLKTWLLPLAEVGILAYILINLRKARRNYRSRKDSVIDFYTTVTTVAKDILPSIVARIVATEIAVIYYGLIYWKPRSLKTSEFSSHKNSSSVSLFLGIMLVIGVETMVFHSMLQQAGNSKAWGITLLSIYSILQILGFLKSLIKRPISFEGNTLHLRYGIMKETSIALDNIGGIVLSSKNTDVPLGRLSIFGIHEGHNVILHLKEEETLYGLYGIKKNYTSIAFYVDEPQEFFDTVCDSVKNGTRDSMN